MENILVMMKAGNVVAVWRDHIKLVWEQLPVYNVKWGHTNLMMALIPLVINAKLVHMRLLVYQLLDAAIAFMERIAILTLKQFVKVVILAKLYLLERAMCLKMEQPSTTVQVCVNFVMQDIILAMNVMRPASKQIVYSETN